MMNSIKQLFPFIFLVLFLSGELELQGEAKSEDDWPTKLFVFGDSYVDTGNTRQDLPGAWKEPYGITFPGEPSGRFSDGKVFSDYIAEYLGLESPVPYELREQYPEKKKYGMNFAVGGTGVVDTTTSPNMTEQINYFQKLIEDKEYSPSDLDHSLAYVSVAGNDYFHYFQNNGSTEDLPPFMVLVVNQTITNLIRIHSLGVRKVVVGGLQPLGCLPKFVSHFITTHCNLIIEYAVAEHNKFLQQSLIELNQQVKVNSTFVMVDLYDSFKWVLDHPEAYNLHDQYQACCDGISDNNVCGSVDENNVRMYKVCDNPKMAFFWDLFHPTHAGWNAVYNKLQTMNALQPIMMLNDKVVQTNYASY